MIPSVLSQQVKTGVTDFLRTTFPITSPFFAHALDALLEQHLFQGPYVTIKLPFVTASGQREWFPGLLPEAFRPHRHQELAWERLQRLRGASTLIATGTGSGKTECFLYPILDYCQAMQGRAGMKAILVYPMNALATDQAHRLARAIWQSPALRGRVTAGLYIGEATENPAAAMTETDVITDKAALRQNPPDILITNYKMLDYLLLRPSDFRLWRHNEPETLKYLVVDEIHTFDGAQGADLACLIRRIKERVKAPEGHLCCVGTSATLGTGEQDAQPAELITFASQVFGEPFDAGSIIGEALVGVDEFLKGKLIQVALPPGRESAGRLDPLGYSTAEEYLRAQYQEWFGRAAEALDEDWQVRLGEELQGHAFFRNLLNLLGGRAVGLDELSGEFRRQLPGFRNEDAAYLDGLLVSFLSLVSAARVRQGGRLGPLVQVRLQLWLRELRRMVSPVSASPALTHADDLKADERKRSLPVIHCRECGLTGWAGTQRDADNRLNPDLQAFYTAFFAHSPNVVYLFPQAAQLGAAQLPLYLCSHCLTIEAQNEPEECGHCGAGAEELIAVWRPDMNRTVVRNGNSRRVSVPDCPACGGHNSLTIIGSRAASLTSVILAQLFTSPFNRDKKLLAFSDSVQDASHRAGFFSARTYTFNLRAALQKVVQSAEGPIPFDQLTTRFWSYWQQRLTEADFIATFLPPDMNWLEDYAYLREHGRLPEGSNLLELVRKRLDWEIWSEYTFDCRIGRTLEKTGASTIEVRPELWEPVVDALHEKLREELGFRDVDRVTVARFLFGFVNHLRERGGVLQAEIGPYVESLGDGFLLGKQRGGSFRAHRPNLSSYSRLPVFLAGRASERFQTLLRSAASATWYEDWLSRCLAPVVAGAQNYVREVYEQVVPLLRESGLLFERFPRGTTVWGLQASPFQTSTGVAQLRCAACSSAASVPLAAAEWLDGSACYRYQCGGKLAVVASGEDYYRRLYVSGDVERIFAEEHTGLLSRAARERVEEGFKHRVRPGDPNLLSCTPTLEMGINIGDLSSLALCSVPPKPSNYVQRSGRAGRVDGNSFVFTVANGRPHDLFFYFEPKEMLEGSVEPPGLFLNASAVLERQFTAFVFDRWVENGAGQDELPDQMRPVLDAVEANRADKGFPSNVLRFLESKRVELEDSFLRLFGEELKDYTRDRLRAFSSGSDLENPGLEAAIWKGLRELADERKGFRNRIEALRKKIRSLEQSPAQDAPAQEQLRELQLERSALTDLVAAMNAKSVLNFLTDEGLLPNYAFPEQGVQLRSVIYRQNPNAGPEESRFKTSIYEYERPASAALMELAPANRFYAEGRRLEIDQISLEHSKPEVWRFCNDCSFMALDENLGQTGPCPKCGSALWSDEGQRRTILRMRQVISTMSEQESRSYDESEDREPQFYQKNMFVDINDADITQAFALDRDDVPFGFEFFRKVALREVNFGQQAAEGGRIRIAGRDLFDKPFEICKGCGRIRKERGRMQHAFSCRYWGNEQQEQFLQACYLYREFSSEAIRILLPVANANLERDIHSFVAALDLGLRKRFRGDPGHMLTTLMDEPVPGSGIRKRYLVLYDGVPGGTGYLKELMRDPQSLLEVFEKAQEVLLNCRCQEDPEKDGCYRCLLAYRGRHDHLNTSRQAAIEILSLILDHKDALKPAASLRAIRLNSRIESDLEARFIEALRRVPGWGLTSQVVNGKGGFYLRTPQGNYLIEAQAEMGPRQSVTVASRADFLITPERPLPGELPIAIFTDGYEFHADPHGHLRTGMDTAQRLAIQRSKRYRVWSLTWDDVEEYLQTAPLEYKAELLLPGPGFGGLMRTLDPTNAHRWADLGRFSSFGLLIAALGEAREASWRKCALGYLAGLLENLRCGKGDVFHHRDALLLDEAMPEWPLAVDPLTLGSSPWRIGRAQKMVNELPLVRLLTAFEESSLATGKLDRCVAVLRLEDTSAAEDPAVWKRCWREFLRLTNLLQFAGPAECVSALGLRDALYRNLLDVAELLGESVPERIATLFDLIDLSVQPLVWAAAEANRELPEAGFELAANDGEIIAMAELAWPESRVAVLLEEDPAARRAFEDAGWHVMLAAVAVGDPAELVACLIERS